MSVVGSQTAISRSSPPEPLRFLYGKGLIKGRALDYGCGQHIYFGMQGYDPAWYPVDPYGQYDTITCNYVLNVVDSATGRGVLRHIQHLLKPSGTAYIAVRRDIPREGKRGKDTWQRYVILNLPVLSQNSTRAIYIMKKTDKTVGGNPVGKIKLVVINENTLAYSLPTPGWYGILHASKLRGATRHDGDIQSVTSQDKVRLASEKDFKDYRVSFKGYRNDSQYQWAGSILDKRRRNPMRGLGSYPREFWIHKQAKEMATGPLNSVVYGYVEANKYYAMAFKGKSNKPVWNYYFRSEEARQKYINDWFEGLGRTAQWKQERAESRKLPAPQEYVVGKILYDSWGYEQTNIDFYKIMKRSGDTVTLAPMTSNEIESTGWLQGRVIPDKVIKDESKWFRRKVLKSGGKETGVKIHSFSWASLWDGRALHYTAYHNPRLGEVGLWKREEMIAAGIADSGPFTCNYCGHNFRQYPAYVKHIEKCARLEGMKTHRNKYGGLVVPLPGRSSNPFRGEHEYSVKDVYVPIYVNGKQVHLSTVRDDWNKGDYKGMTTTWPGGYVMAGGKKITLNALALRRPYDNFLLLYREYGEHLIPGPDLAQGYGRAWPHRSHRPRRRNLIKGKSKNSPMTNLLILGGMIGALAYFTRRR